MSNAEIKEQVHDYWNKQACGTAGILVEKFTREYFDQLEDRRYRAEPDVFSFAQFTRYYGKKVLEVGIGPATDFLQWVRAGATAYGVDLTQEAVDHAKHRLEVYGLTAADVRVADAESLPYPDNCFDLVYSWGVIHHTPDTVKALSELIRCAKPGGRIKVMIYNRHSLLALRMYARFGLLEGKPFRSISDILYHHMESIGTKAFTFSEVYKLLSAFPVDIVSIKANPTTYDLGFFSYHKLPIVFGYLMACFLGFTKCGWFMTIELVKRNHQNLDHATSKKCD